MKHGGFLFFLLFTIIFTGKLFAQPGTIKQSDITGIWKGELYVDSTKKFHPYEVSISENKGKLTGYSRITFEEKGIRQIVIRDHSVIMEGNQLIIEDDKQLSKGSTVNQPKEVRKKMIVQIEQADSVLMMKGTWSTNRTRFYLAATGSVVLEKKKDFASSELYKKLDSLSMTSNLSYNKPSVPEPTATAPSPAKPVKEPASEPDRYLIKKGIGEVKSKERSNVKSKPLALAGKPVAIIKPRPMAVIVDRDKIASEPVKPVVPVVKAPVVKEEPPVVAKADPPKPPVVRRMEPVADAGNAAKEVSNRTNTKAQEVYINSDSLQLTLYDNGEIDGDTVSVLMNGKVIIARYGLTTKPNSHTVYFDESTPDEVTLVMYAENLGSIPPNTGLLIVKDGSSTYEVRFSADLKTNAAILLKRRRN